MLFPKKTKYNKAHKGRARGTSKNVLSHLRLLFLHVVESSSVVLFNSSCFQLTSFLHKFPNHSLHIRKLLCCFVYRDCDTINILLIPVSSVGTR